MSSDQTSFLVAMDDYWRAYYERRAATLRAEMESRDEKERVLRLQHEFTLGRGFQVALTSLANADYFYQSWYEEQERSASLLRANAELHLSLKGLAFVEQLSRGRAK